MNVSAIVVMLWSLLAAQAATGSRIEGTVVDAVTQKPVAGVMVTPMAPEGSSAPQRPVTTSSDGTFVLENVQLNRVMLGTFKPGYPFEGTLLTLTPGSRINNLVIRLRPTGIVVGRVMEPNGRPAVQARVYLQEFDSTESNPGTDAFSTNDRGEFRADLEEGTYLVAYASGRQALGFATPPEGTAGKLYYPGVPDTTRALAVQVKAGQETRIQDVVLTPTKPAAIRLHIVNETGLRAPAVVDFGIVNGNRPQGFNGLYIEVPGGWDRELTREYWPPMPGTYAITAGWKMRDDEGATVRASKIVDFTGAPVEVELRIEKAEGRLRGRVTEQDPNGGPPKPFENARVSLREEDNPEIIDDVFIRSDGTFSFSKLPSGRYEVRLMSLPGDYYQLATPANVVVGKTEATIDLTVASGAVTVTGKATDKSGAAAHNARIVLAPVSGGSSETATSTSDQNGAFQLRYVTPGAYRLYAFPAGMFPDRAGAEALKKFEGRAKTVTVERGKPATVTISLIE